MNFSYINFHNYSRKIFTQNDGGRYCVIKMWRLASQYILVVLDDLYGIYHGNFPCHVHHGERYCLWFTKQVIN